MNKKMIIGLVVALVVVVGIVGIVASQSNNSSKTKTSTNTADVASATATNAVSIKNYMFTPMAIKVKVGTKVTWTNTDEVHHSITADSGGMPNSPLFGKGETYSYTFAKAGTFTYHCMPHPYMHGTVIVTN